jgi:hypothetical protein
MLEALIAGDWEAAGHEIERSRSLIEQTSEPGHWRLLLFDAIARLGFRQWNRRLQSETIEHLAASAEKVSETEQPRWMAAAELARGSLKFQTQDFEGAAGHLETASRVQGSPFFSAMADHTLGQCALAAGHLEQGRQHLERAHDSLTAFAQQSKLPYLQRLARLTAADALRSLAEYLRGVSRPDDAAAQREQDRLCHDALVSYQREGDLQGEARTYVLLARSKRIQLEVMAEEGRELDHELVEAAEWAWKHAEAIVMVVDDPRGKALLAWEAAGLAEVRGEWDSARTHYLHASHHFEFVGDELGVASVESGLADMERKRGDLRASLRSYQKCFERLVNLGHDAYRAQVLVFMGWLSWDLHEPDPAEASFARARDIADAALHAPVPPHLLASLLVGLAAARLVQPLPDQQDCAQLLARARELEQDIALRERKALDVVVNHLRGRLDEDVRRAIENLHGSHQPPPGENMA